VASPAQVLRSQTLEWLGRACLWLDPVERDRCHDDWAPWDESFQWTGTDGGGLSETYAIFAAACVQCKTCCTRPATIAPSAWIASIHTVARVHHWWPRLATGVAAGGPVNNPPTRMCVATDGARGDEPASELRRERVRTCVGRRRPRALRRPTHAQSLAGAFASDRDATLGGEQLPSPLLTEEGRRPPRCIYIA